MVSSPLPHASPKSFPQPHSLGVQVFARHIARFYLICIPALLALPHARTFASGLQIVSSPAADRHAMSAQTIPLARSSWFWSSTPFQDEQGTPVPGLVSEHCRLEWYNARGVKEHDLNPVLTSAEGGNNEHTVLEMNIKPPTGGTSIFPTNWTGLTQSLSAAGQDSSKLYFLQIWVNDFTPYHSLTHAKLHLDFGRVSEDAFWTPNSVPNGILDTEDRNGDLRLDVGEDTGIDGMFSAQEPGYDAITNPDPNGDNYFYDPNNPGDYSRINGTEGSGSGNPNAQPDTEDLNRDGFADFQDDYFEATLDLSDTAFVAIDVPRDYAGDPDVRPDNGWRLFRVPTTDQVFMRIGTPRWENIDHARIWVNGMSAPLKLQVGGIEFVGASVEPSAKGVLCHAVPNPASGEVTFVATLPRTGHARLRLYDLHGRLVVELLDGIVSAGPHLEVWSGRDASGGRVGSGVYMYRLDADGSEATGSVVLMR